MEDTNEKQKIDQDNIAKEEEVDDSDQLNVGNIIAVISIAVIAIILLLLLF